MSTAVGGAFWADGWTVQTLGGVQGVYADAKSSVANPEPRLGWTSLGDFEVIDVGDGGAAMDGAARDGAARDGGAGGPCRAAAAVA